MSQSQVPKLHEVLLRNKVKLEINEIIRREGVLLLLCGAPTIRYEKGGLGHNSIEGESHKAWKI
jgi:hypothetical protein